MNVLARNVRVEVIDVASAALLQTALQTFLAGLGEGVLLSVDYRVGTTYSAMVLYTR